VVVILCRLSVSTERSLIPNASIGSIWLEHADLEGDSRAILDSTN